MDIGCRFYTPVEISDDIAIHAGKKELLVDLYSGSGNLYKSFFKMGYAVEVLAFDINQSPFIKNNYNGKVTNIVVDCLDPREVKNKINGYRKKPMTFVLNPPFKRIGMKEERSFWKRFNGYQPSLLTRRIECVAIAAAIQAASKNSVFYIILPELVLNSQQTSSFFETLKTSYSMSVVKKYKKARFSSAEVDVAVIMLKKQSIEYIEKLIERQVIKKQQTDLSCNSKKSINQDFHLFRGRVRHIIQRKFQISAKDLKIGGINISGNKNRDVLLKTGEKNYSVPGDIFIVRVGRRMIGRVGILSNNCVLTNESIITLRIPNKKTRMAVYDILKSSSFISWCDSAVRGTANYFITNRDLKCYITNLIKNII